MRALDLSNLLFYLEARFCQSACETFHLSFAKYDSRLRGFVLPADMRTGSAATQSCGVHLVIASARLESDKLDPESSD
jgi:hypothetical protein